MRTRLVSTAAALGLLALAITGCGKKKTSDTFLPNMQPEVRLTQAPVTTQDEYFYAYRMNWVGYDPDGRVDYFMIAVDPDQPDVVDTTTRAGQPVWSKTTKLEEVMNMSIAAPTATPFADSGLPIVAFKLNVSGGMTDVTRRKRPKPKSKPRQV